MDPASYLALQLRLSHTEPMMNSRREELALQDQRLETASEALRESDGIKEKLESQLLALQSLRGNLNLSLSKNQCISKAAQQDLEESQSRLGLIEKQFMALENRSRSISKATQAGTLTMNRLTATVDSNNVQDGDQAKQIQDKIDRVEAVLRFEIQKGLLRIDAEEDKDVAREIDSVKEKISNARKELEAVRSQVQH